MATSGPSKSGVFFFLNFRFEGSRALDGGSTACCLSWCSLRTTTTARASHREAGIGVQGCRQGAIAEQNQGTGGPRGPTFFSDFLVHFFSFSDIHNAHHDGHFVSGTISRFVDLACANRRRNVCQPHPGFLWMGHGKPPATPARARSRLDSSPAVGIPGARVRQTAQWSIVMVVSRGSSCYCSA